MRFSCAIIPGAGSLCIGGRHFGSEDAAVVRSRGVAAKQGFR